MIGVFDSGVGGLSVLREIRGHLPQADLLYVADRGRAPYGTRTLAEVSAIAHEVTDWLVGVGATCVVVACNTASAMALGDLEVELPIWGVLEPGARWAAEKSAGRVGVIATESTVRSGAYARTLLALRPALHVVSRACPLFVPLVEEGWTDDPITRAVAERYLRPLLEDRIDTLVLGCTHFPFVEPLIAAAAGPGSSGTFRAAARRTTLSRARGLASSATTTHRQPSPCNSRRIASTPITTPRPR